MDASNDAARRARQRVMWVLGPLFFVVGIVAGSLLVHAALTRTASSVPAPDAANVPAIPGSNSPHSNSASPLPGNAPAAPDNAPSNDALPNAPGGEVPAEPGASPPSPALFQLIAGKAARVQRRGEGGYRALEGGLAQGDVLRVEHGEARIESAAVFAVLGDRGEVEVLAEHSLRLLRGRLVLRILKEGCVFQFNDTTIATAVGEYVVGILSGHGQLEVVCGSAEVAREQARARVNAGAMVVLSGELQVLPMEADAAKARRAEVDLCVTSLMRWDFENGSGTCDLGKVVEGGVDGGHALRWDATQVGAGTSLWPALFRAVPATRLRVWVLTDAAHVDVTARMHVPEGVHGVSARLAVPAGEGWRMIDVPFDVFLGRKRDQPGFVVGAEYSGLQFSVPPSREELLVSRPLAIDDVTVYALNR